LLRTVAQKRRNVNSLPNSVTCKNLGINYWNSSAHVPRDLSSVYSLGMPAGRETPKIPSLNSGPRVCGKKENPIYTGDKVKGIGTMHKSNAVPIFSDEEAVAIATMRRG
jgi:hypothetical protein